MLKSIFGIKNNLKISKLGAPVFLSIGLSIPGYATDLETNRAPLGGIKLHEKTVHEHQRNKGGTPLHTKKFHDSKSSASMHEDMFLKKKEVINNHINNANEILQAFTSKEHESTYYKKYLGYKNSLETLLEDLAKDHDMDIQKELVAISNKYLSNTATARIY